MEWQTDKIFRLIDLFEAKQCLWNPRHKNYKKNTIKSEAWKDLSAEINVNPMDAKRKMDSLLASYRRERQKAELAHSGAAADDAVYVSKWFAFNAFKFLNDKYSTKAVRSTTNETPKRERSSIDSFIEETTRDESAQAYDDDDDDDDDPLTSNDISYDVVHGEESATSSTQPTNKKRKVDESATAQKQLKGILSHFSRYAESRPLPTPAASKHQPFLQLVEQKLDALPEDHQEDVKLGIITYIFDYVKDFKNKAIENEEFL